MSGVLHAFFRQGVLQSRSVCGAGPLETPSVEVLGAIELVV